jgi:hypothetical protein
VADHHGMSRTGLSPEEDAELRRLHFFRRFGVVASRFSERYNELRHRDRRLEIRDPDERPATAFFAR